METNTRSRNTKSPAATFGEVGTVRVTYANQEYVFGPNQSKSFSDDGVAQAVAAAHTSLRVAESTDGMPKIAGNASLSITSW